MDRMRKILACCGHNFRKWLSSPRMLALVLLIGLILESSVHELADFVRSNDLIINFWGLYPMLASQTQMRLLLSFGTLILLCDAPFVDEVQPYLLLRSGRWNWVWGQVLYMALAIIIYQLTVNLISGLLLWGQLSFSGVDWENGWMTIQYLDFTMGLPELVSAPSRSVNFRMPTEAWIMSMTLDFMGYLLTGSLVFAVNQCFRGNKGVVVGGVFVMTETIILFGDFPLLWFWSPLTLCNLENLDMGFQPSRPDVNYAFTLLPVLCIIMLGIVVWSGRFKPIEVRSDVR